MKITVAIIKALRKDTGCSMMDCKRALEESNGDYELAKARLNRRGHEDPEQPSLVE